MKVHVGRMTEDKTGETGRGPTRQNQKDYVLCPKSIRKQLKVQGIDMIGVYKISLLSINR